MNANRQQYAKGTWTESTGPWGLFTRARARCEDGRLRTVKLSVCADSFFSVPARVSFRGKTVCGFITFAADSGLSTDHEGQYVQFIATGRHANIFLPQVMA
jgi:hypothetical protein